MIQIPTLTEQSLREMIYTTVKGCLAEMQLDLYNSSPAIQKVEPEPEKPQLKRKDKGFYRELVEYYIKHLDYFKWRDDETYEKRHTLFISCNNDGAVYIDAFCRPHSARGGYILWSGTCCYSNHFRPSRLETLLYEFLKYYKDEYYTEFTKKELISLIIFLIKYMPFDEVSAQNIKEIKARFKEILSYKYFNKNKSPI